MDSQQQFCLKWNSFGSNLATTFGNLFKSESLTDVTLFCQGVTFKAHRLILAACSKHFQDLFETAPLSPSVLVILDGTSSSNMSALLEFMYKGEVHVSQECLSSFLKAAECLQVKGLSIEHEKLAVVHGKHVSPESHESQLDSPTGRKLTKLNSSGNSGGNGGTKEMLDGNPAADQLHPQHHASTSASASYSPVMSPYMHPPHYRPAYEQRVPASAPASSHYDASPRKRHHRSSSEAMQDAAAVRASVLRDGSKARPTEAEKLSPMSLAYRPSLSQPQPQVESESKSDDKVYQSGSSQLHMRYEGGPDARDSAASNAAASATAAVTFDRTAAVDIENNIKIKSESRRQSLDPGNSCPEDQKRTALRMLALIPLLVKTECTCTVCLDQNIPTEVLPWPRPPALSSSPGDVVGEGGEVAEAEPKVFKLACSLRKQYYLCKFCEHVNNLFCTYIVFALMYI
ncbi:broad-complex core protein isoforms 1/2/3/4/5 isoform X2 [Anabrus simplex]|uniref:broad-complex core protein isoforms 1/2/3/4/5 isoform X2 n=1 Tax=Anabrus simplex TaxID=316456 RepID=UPI0035A3CCD1